MKKMLITLIAVAVLSGCAASSKDITPDPALLASASTVAELLPYMTGSDDQRLYSEADKKSSLPRYFDFIDYTKDEYFVAEENGEKYALFYYRLYSSLKSVIGVDAVEKTYGGKDGGDLTLSATVSYFYNEGYHETISPPLSYVRCIVKLDRDIDRLIVDDTVYQPFEGGIMTIGGKMCTVDKELNLRTPPRFDYIEVILNTESGETVGINNRYYRCFENGKCGILNNKFELLIEPEYDKIKYFGDGRFLARKGAETGTPEEKEFDFRIN